METEQPQHERDSAAEHDQQEKCATSSSSLEAIKGKLSTAGLTDVVTARANPSRSDRKPRPRSRSLGESALQKELRALPSSVVTRSLKLSTARLEPAQSAQGLEQIKQKLLVEIKIKLKRQLQQTECHTETDGERPAAQAAEHKKEPEEHTQDKIGTAEAAGSENGEANTTAAAPEVVVTRRKKSDASQGDVAATVNVATSPTGDEATTNKRFSICYSPVYERTRKIVRQSSSSINRWSSSQTQVVAPATPQAAAKPTTEPSSSPADCAAPVLSPVTSKGELEEGEHNNSSSTATNTKMEQEASRELLASKSSSTSTRIAGGVGGYSAHPSVFMMEQERRTSTSTGFDGSRSEKMDRSTNTLKRGASFKGLRKNLKKTFSTNIPAPTLEKADKAPDSNVPAIVVYCVDTLRKKGFLRTEGLYRSSPSQLEVRKLIKHAQKRQYEYVTSVDDPVVLTGAVKSFFFALKTHLISQEAMEKNFPKRCLLSVTSEREYVDRLASLISDLDALHYDTLEFIVKHLQEVASHSKYNLMNPVNLGVVWAPCLFTNCDKSMDSADLLSAMGEQTRLLSLLITHADQLFDRYAIDEIMLAIEDGSGEAEAGEPTLNLRPDFDVTGADWERRKLLRNLSLTLDNLCDATTAEPVLEASRNGNGNGHGRFYDLQNSYTVPTMSSAQSDGMGQQQKILKMKRSKSRAACVLS